MTRFIAVILLVVAFVCLATAAPQRLSVSFGSILAIDQGIIFLQNFKHFPYFGLGFLSVCFLSVRPTDELWQSPTVARRYWQPAKGTVDHLDFQGVSSQLFSFFRW